MNISERRKKKSVGGETLEESLGMLLGVDPDEVKAFTDAQSAEAEQEAFLLQETDAEQETLEKPTEIAEEVEVIEEEPDVSAAAFEELLTDALKKIGEPLPLFENIINPSSAQPSLKEEVVEAELVEESKVKEEHEPELEMKVVPTEKASAAPVTTQKEESKAMPASAAKTPSARKRSPRRAKPKE